MNYIFYKCNVLCEVCIKCILFSLLISEFFIYGYWIMEKNLILKKCTRFYSINYIFY